jgi:hypothetical protein
MLDKLDELTRVSTGASLMTNFVGAMLSLLGFLNSYSAAFSVLLGFSTFVVNILFQYWRTKILEKNNGDDHE